MFEQESHSMFLKFTSQVHPFPFLDSVVEVCVMLCGDTGRIIPGREVPFHIYLQHSDDPHSVLDSQSIEVMNPSSQVINAKTGKSPVIQIRLLTPSRENRDFVLTVCPRVSKGVNASISPCHSSPMQVVRHRILISNEDQIDTVWFKDEGGKSNQITLSVKLVNAQGHLVTNRSGLKLKCLLFYEDGGMVADQSILKISNDTSMFLGSDGSATIRYQIKQISQNHDNRKFKVMVTPDTLHNTSSSDISHHFTPNILVKSKISKANRQKMMEKQQRQEREAAKAMCKDGLTLSPEVCFSAKKKRKISGDGIGQVGDRVRTISPANMTDKLNEGEEGLLQFCDMAVRSLQRLQRQLMTSCLSSSSPFSSASSSLTIIEEILAYHQSLGLPLPQQSPSPQHVPFDEAYEQVFSRYDGTGSDGFGLQHTSRSSCIGTGASVGPEASRETSYFRQAASAVLGPELPNRQHSLSLLPDESEQLW